MPRYCINYRLGDWFVIPLRDGLGYAVGRVARLDHSGGVFGYFFGPRRANVPALADVSKLHAKDAIHIHRFGDLHLVTNLWPILGQEGEFDAKAWPLPALYRSDALKEKFYRVLYNDVLKYVREVPVDRSEMEGKPTASLHGAGAVEIVLTKLLCTTDPVE